MDRDDDVERLFSWIKTPELHYREFAGEREVADAVASWPAPRDAVTEPSHPGEPELEDAEPPQQAAPAYEPEPAPAPRPALGERLISMFGHRQTPPPEPPPPPVSLPPVPPPSAPPVPVVVVQPSATERAGQVPWAPEPPRSSPMFARLEPTPPSPARRPEPAPPPPPPPPEHEYQGFEEPQPAPPAADPAPDTEKRSLDAIFSRVAHPTPAPRDDRKRASAAPGLGPVFRRLR